MTLVPSSVIRVVLLLANAICTHMNTQPPNPPPPEDEQEKFVKEKEGKEFISKNAGWGRPLHQAVCDSLALLESYFILSSQNISTSLTITFGAGLISSCTGSGFQQVGVTPAMIISSILIIIGTMIRFVCFAKLGHLFTFELSVMKDHKLITDGPYAWVRHPAYTGAFMTLFGHLIALYGAGSWRSECGSFLSLFGILGFIWTMQNVLTIGFLISRCTQEDEALKAEFKEKWVAWSKRTPAKLIPYVY